MRRLAPFPPRPSPVFTSEIALPSLDRTTLRLALIGGGVAALTMGGGLAVIGVSTLMAGSERELLEAALPTVRALFTTAMIASSTTLALMLTMLGMTSDQHVKSKFYGQIRQAATLAVGVFTVATVAVLFLSIPFHEGDSSQVPYATLYFVVTGVGALVGGALVAVMITLHQAVGSLIALVDDEVDSGIIASDDEPDEGEPADDAPADAGLADEENLAPPTR